MTSVISDATSTEGVVLGADDIIHLTNGQGDSVGFVIIVGKQAIYIPNDIVDRQNTLTQLNVSLDKIKESLDKLLSITQSISTVITTVPALTGTPLQATFDASVFIPFKTTVDTLKSDIDTVKNDVDTIKTELK